MNPKTPKFIQIAACGTGAGGGSMTGSYGSPYIFGLTAEGDVYEWRRDHVHPNPFQWVRLENPVSVPVNTETP